MKTIQKDIKPGYQKHNESNNHRILCVDSKPIFMGFIGKDLIEHDMTMQQAITWLYEPVRGTDTVCETCATALCNKLFVVAAEGHMFCSHDCARKWKRTEILKTLDLDLSIWQQRYCEELSAVSCGVTDEDPCCLGDDPEDKEDEETDDFEGYTFGRNTDDE